VDTSKLESKLESVVQQLKKIADGGVMDTRTTGGRVVKTLASGEKTKIKLQAKEQALIFKNVLGLGYKEADAKAFSQVLKNTLNLDSVFKDVRDEYVDAIKNIIGSIDNKKGKKFSRSDVNFLLKEMEWSDYFDWIRSISFGIKYLTDQVGVLIDYAKRSLDLTLNPPKKEKTGILSGLGDLKNIGGLAILGVGFALVVGALVMSGKIDVSKTLKVLLVVGSIIGIFLLASKFGSSLKNAAIGFAILSATLLFLVLPLIQKLSKLKPEEAIKGLLGLIVIVGVSLAILYAMNKIKPKDTLMSMAGFLSFFLIVGFIALPLIQYIAKMPLETLAAGLGKFIVIVGVSLLIMNIMKKFSKSDTLKAVGGFALFMATIGLVLLPTLNALTKMKWEDLLSSLGKFGLIAGASMGLMYLMAKITTSDTLKSTAGFLLFSLTLSFVIIPMLKKLVDFKAEEILEALLKMGLISVAMMGLMFLMSKIDGKQVLLSSLGMLALSLLLGFIIVPLLNFLAIQPFPQMLEGLAYAAVAVLGLGLIVRLLGMIVGKGLAQIIIGMGSILALSFLIGFMADQLNKLANKPWKEIFIGLGLASLALTAFGLLVAGIGALVLLPPVALALGAGAAAVFGLIYLMGYLAENLNKFSTVDPDKLTLVGKALSVLGKGLVDFMGGSVGGVVGGIASAFGSFFKVDPVSQLKKFQELDGDKLMKVGLGIKYMGEGLRNLSSNLDLKGVIKDLSDMTSPLLRFSAAIMAFTVAYKSLESLKMDSKLNINVNSDSGIQKAILDIQMQELEVQKAQLEQLKINGQLLSRIAESGGAGGGAAGASGSKNMSVYSPSFKTKDGYLNNMKLLNMSLQS
jgi:hypothetical protein